MYFKTYRSMLMCFILKSVNQGIISVLDKDVNLFWLV